MNSLVRHLLPQWQPFISADSRAVDEDSAAVLAGLERWDVLGPLQIGTREATWGADPLERYGGFRSLSSTDGQSYPSSLATAGRVTWSKQNLPVIGRSRNTIEVRGSFEFTEIDWDGLQSVFGWSAHQYQGWARAEFTFHSETTQRAAIFTDNVLEFWVDDQHFFGGDFYAYRRAPAIVSLTPGKHQLDIRLTRDVRAMGGTGPPDHPLAVKLELCSNDIRLDPSHMILPEMVTGRGLSSPYGSIPLCNTSTEIIQVQDIQSLSDDVELSLLSSGPLALTPGQSRPLMFKMKSDLESGFQLQLALMYTMNSSSHVRVLNLATKITCRKVDEPIKTTFLHPGGIVSYCIVIPPRERRDASSELSRPLPVLLNLHGAGLEADSHQVRHQMDAAERVNAWTIFPTGVTPWSGDDWHLWGFCDVEAAVQCIPAWIKATSWHGPDVNLKQWYVTGHSNGGQGTWFAMTHNPDCIVAGAPVSGYLAIQAYVSYNMWNEMRPSIWKCIQTSMANYRHELLLSNMAGIHIVEQHGSADDNVPPYHSRRMHQLLRLLRLPVQYHELPGKGHWFDGAMTTEPLRRFYQKIDPADKKYLPQSNRIVVPNSDAMRSCGGIMVDQLSRSDEFGIIDVERADRSLTWCLKTSNIHRFHLSPDTGGTFPSKMCIDGVAFENITSKTHHFVRGKNWTWKLIETTNWKHIGERSGRQRGAMDAILQTEGAFVLQYEPPFGAAIALQISRNLFQYYGADSEIVGDLHPRLYSGNSVIITVGEQVNSLRWDGPISVTSAGISIVTRSGKTHHYPTREGLGVIYIAPRPNEALELRIWGNDIAALDGASRLVPMLTGTGQPDFIVVDSECRWSGAAGVRALGFFDHDWQVSEGSYLF